MANNTNTKNITKISLSFPVFLILLVWMISHRIYTSNFLAQRDIIKPNTERAIEFNSKVIMWQNARANRIVRWWYSPDVDYVKIIEKENKLIEKK